MGVYVCMLHTRMHTSLCTICTTYCYATDLPMKVFLQTIKVEKQTEYNYFHLFCPGKNPSVTVQKCLFVNLSFPTYVFHGHASYWSYQLTVATH